MSDPLVHGVATPERVALSLPVAGIGSRTGAYLVDVTLIFFFWVSLYFAVSLLIDVVDALRGMSGLLMTLAVVGVFAVQWIYWTACEVLWHGQTPGKRIAGIRVVRSDGSPVGFFESAVRNLLRAIDFLPALYATGITSMLLTRQHRRLGDLAAGTVMVREEKVNLDRYAAASEASARQSSRPLTSEDTEIILSFLDRAATLAPDARQRLAAGLLAKVASELPPEERARLAASAGEAERFLRQRVHGHPV